MGLSLETIIHYLPEGVRHLVYSPSVTDIMVRGKRIFIEENGEKKAVDSEIDAFSLRTLINYIAGECDETVNEAHPILDGRLPDGSRCNAVIAPVSFGGDTLTIRKFGGWRSMDELIIGGSIPEQVATILYKAIEEHGNIVLSGATSSGKTTMLNALLARVPLDEQLVVIERPAELQIQHLNAPRWSPRTGGVGIPPVTWSDLIEAALRSNPDRIILGEIRDHAAYDLIQALNTGHGGSMSTTHANSCHDALERLSDMALSARSNLTQEFIRRAVARSINYVVQVKKHKGVRRVTEMVRVTGYKGETFTTDPLYSY